jgi:hypothetical protein
MKGQEELLLTRGPSGRPYVIDEGGIHARSSSLAVTHARDARPLRHSDLLQDCLVYRPVKIPGENDVLS